MLLVDSLRWSHGELHPASLIGDLALPLVATPIVAAGRVAGNWETAAQSWTSAGAGIAAGFAVAFLYAALQRPECGYTSSLICY
jgi:hypothetical protein